MFRVSIVFSVVLSSMVAAQGRTVVICAPERLRAPLLSEITAQGRVVIDLSDLEVAMYGKDGAKARVAAGRSVSLPASVPKEVRADFAKGQAACRAREKQGAEARLACAEHLVGAVWERHLDRLRVERVIEVQDDFAMEGAVQMATYQPGDATIAGMVKPPAAHLKALAEQLVDDALGGPLPPAGSRPNTRILPGLTPPAPAALGQGSPQSLAALPMPKGCAIGRSLSIEPASAPLAVTMGTLWRATLGTHAREGAEPLLCTLELTGARERPTAVNFTCGSELATVGLYAGTQFGDASFQAGLARLFVSSQLRSECDVANGRAR